MEMGSRKGAGRGPPWRRRVDPDLRRRAKPAWRSGEKWGRCEQDGEPGAGAQPAAPLLQASGPTWAEESPQAVGTRGSAGSACERGRWGGATAGWAAGLPAGPPRTPARRAWPDPLREAAGAGRPAVREAVTQR